MWEKKSPILTMQLNELCHKRAPSKPDEANRDLQG